MPADVSLFRCLSDNYGVLLHDPGTGATAAIDAPEAAPVEAALKAKGWKLTDILVTHHHADHTDGIPALKDRHKCRVVAPQEVSAKYSFVDETVREGDKVKVGSLVGNVIDTPGHTAGHVSYWFHDDALAFVGDTLFSIGCGRVLEGTPEMMWTSIKKLRDLPDNTEIYCGHEYSESNARFALTIDPENSALKERAKEIKTLREADLPTLPTTLMREMATNPFLRWHDPAIRKNLKMESATDEAVFAEIRKRKDNF